MTTKKAISGIDIFKRLAIGAFSIALLSTPAYSQWWSLTGNAATGTDFLGTTNAVDLRIRTANTERMRILNTNGFVGIGTTTPEFRLSVLDDGGIMAKGTLSAGTTLTTTGSGVRMFFYPRKAAFRAGEAYLDSWDDANVGLNSIALGWNPKASGSYSTAIGSGVIASGTVSTAFGEVTESTGFASTTMGHRTKATGDASTAIGQYVDATANYNVVIGNGVSSVSRLANSTANSLMVGFNSTVPTLFVGPASGAGTYGKVGIANSNPQTALHVNNGRIRLETTSDANHAIEFLNSSANRRWNMYQLASSSGISANGFYLEYYDGFNFFGRVTIDQNGNFGIGTTTPGVKLDVNGGVRGTSAYQISDARFKRDIMPIGGAVSTIMNLNGVSYDWRRDEFPEINFDARRQYGFIAQDIQKVIPDVVMEDNKGYLSVSYTEIVPILVEAVKEQQTTISEQSARIARLEEALKGLGVDLSTETTPATMK